MTGRRISSVLFWSALVVGALAHISTLPYSPVHWQDEVQICEIGRMTLSASDWTAYWMPIEGSSAGAPIPWITAAVPQELAYRFMGEDGVRVVPLLVLLLSTIVLRMYLIERIGNGYLSDCVSLLYFTCPSLVQSVRGARVDVWSFLYIWVILLMLNKVVDAKGVRQSLLLFGVGVLSVVCVFCWGTALILMPIVLWGVIEGLYKSRAKNNNAIVLLSWIILGGFVAFAILMLPFMGRWAVMTSVLEYISGTVTPNRGSLRMGEFMSAISTFPGLYFLGAICMFMRMELLGITIGGCLFLLTWILSEAYVFRALYFLPYCILSVAFVTSKENRGWIRRLLFAVIVAMLSMSYVWSVILRNGAELFTRQYRNYATMAGELETVVGRNAKVYVNTYQVYFIGRELGWRMFREFHIGGKVPVECLAKAEWFIAEKDGGETSGITDAAIESLSQLGFSKVADVSAPEPKCRTILHSILENRNRVSPLGPYVVYRRNL